MGELVHGAFHAGSDRVSGLPVGRLLLGADAELQVAEFSRGKAHVPGASREVVHWSRTGQGWYWLLVNRATISGAAVGEEVGVGALPASADLSLGADDLLAIEVDMEVVPVEAFVVSVLPGGVARQWSGDGDLVFSGGMFQVNQGGVTTVDKVFGGQQATALQTSVDTGQRLRIACRGRGGGHVRDHVGAFRRTGFSEVGEESRPSGGLSPTCVAGGGVIGRDDRAGRGRQPAIVLGAPTQTAHRVAVVVLHDDLPQRLDTGTERVAPPVRTEMFQ
ncbi:hypothetical protein [Actinophytocola sp.]|uniref:hypothetical protein n=1 Tax=Actinophytocola sp. TaxID=1872138 RepID=UPI002ED44A55